MNKNKYIITGLIYFGLLLDKLVYSLIYISADATMQLEVANRIITAMDSYFITFVSICVVFLAIDFMLWLEKKPWLDQDGE